MSTILDARGEEVSIGKYMNEQVKTMACFAVNSLRTGSEENAISDEQWSNLQNVRLYGKSDSEALRALGMNPTISYLIDLWIRKYAPIFGALSRIDQQPLETVRSTVEAYQARVVQNIGSLRFFWHQQTGQLLPLQTAMEQVRWNGPRIQQASELTLIQSEQTEYLLAVDALLPHVCTENSVTNLVFDSSHITPHTLRVFVQPENVEALEKDLANYT